jgi:hypothetical protein
MHMTTSEIEVIRRTLELLHKLLPEGEPRAGGVTLQRCPVTQFAQQYLGREPGSCMTSAELWQFYSEVAASGELEPLSKSEFLRRLPGVMEAVFGVRKSHNVMRAGRRLRGFRSVTIPEGP